MPCPKLKNHLTGPFPPSLEILLFWVHVLIIVSFAGLGDLWAQQLTQLLNMLLPLRQASYVINMIYLPLSWKPVGKIGLPFVVLPSLMNWLVIKKKMLNMSLYAYIYIYILFGLVSSFTFPYTKYLKSLGA